MADRTEDEEKAINGFLQNYFSDDLPNRQTSLTDGWKNPEIEGDEREVIEELIKIEQNEFASSKGTLGLALDFLMVAEQLSQLDDWASEFSPDVTTDDVLNRYEQASVKSTLTFKYEGQRFGIRPVQNAVIDLFREDLKRTNFPSSPGHHTGEWERYTSLLEMSFQLSTAGRYEAAQRLIDFGLEQLERKDITNREPPFPSPFLKILQDYERSHPGEEGGLTYQSWAYGFVKAEWPHLSLEASKVRTGSSRQNRYGDIDGFEGPDLMVSVEVKDRSIDSTNVQSELGSMMELAENATTIAVAICREVTEDAMDSLTDSGVHVLTDESLENRLELWDYHKQNRAVQGMAHYLTNVEEDPDALQRLLQFIQDVDPENTALAHLTQHD